jgi:hypothetical protein
MLLSCSGLSLEGTTGIEPASSVWKTEALPLSYVPVNMHLAACTDHMLLIARGGWCTSSGRLLEPDITKPNSGPQCQMCISGRYDRRLFCALTGCSSAWLERLLWEQEVAGSNPVTPTLQLVRLLRLQNPIPQNQEYLDCEERCREPHPHAGQAQC